MVWLSSGKKLKGLRIAVAVTYMLLITAIFVDVKDWIPVSVSSWISSFQFVPAVLRVFHDFSVITLSFIFVLLMTFTLGRLYCSTFCPLGILQDIVLFIQRKIKKRKYRSLSRMRVLRYSVLALFVIGLIATNMLFLIIFDPYSLYGRFATGVFNPIVVWGNNALVSVLENMGNHSIYPVDSKLQDVFLTIIALVSVGAIVLWTLFKGRIYCNTLCPVGVFLGLLSRLSFFKIRIDKNTCNSCGLCERDCKAGCISSVDKKIDWSRCVVCFDCLDSCKKGGINIQKFEQKSFLKNTSEGRRQFLKSGLLLATGTSVLPVTGIKEKTEDLSTLPVMPPGAISKERFSAHCTACQLCVSQCPTGVLQPSFLEYGLSGFMQPRMNFDSAYCTYECKVCGDVCPSGAIQKKAMDEKKLIRIGTAKFDKELCVVYTDETDCIACGEHCPTKALEMVSYKGSLVIPTVNEDLCIGCGACEYACPVRPVKAIKVKSLAVHEVAEAPVSKKQILKPTEEDFPF